MKKNEFIIGLICILFFAGCDSYLERYPLDAPSADTFFTNETEIEGGVNGCYSFLSESTGYTDAVTGFDCLTDIMFIRNGNGDENAIRGGSHDFKTGYFSTVWGRLYQGIGRCNLILQKIEENEENLSQNKAKQFKGEVYFLRAYYYLKLISHFGDVQYTDEPVESISDAISMPRTSKDDILKYIYQDLDNANELLSEITQPFGRVTWGAALAYKARAALYNADYATAATTAKQLIDSNQYNLYPNYKNLFSESVMRDPQNKEMIFMMDYDLVAKKTHSYLLYAGSRAMGGWSTIVPTQNMIDTYECIDGKDLNESSLFNKAEPFSNRDPRLSYSVILPGDVWGDNVYETHADSLECYNFKEGERIKNIDCFTHSPFTSFTGYLPRKYAEMSYLSSATQCENPFYLCRFAEVLLTYAEAKIELNQIDADCLNAINRVRNERDDVKMPEIQIGKSQIEMRKIIRRERKVELAFESLRLQDLRRWKAAEKVLNGPMFGRPIQGSYTEWPNIEFDENGDPVYNYQNYVPHPSKDYRVIFTYGFNPQRDYLWPIPERELLINPNLGQNPNYN